MMGSHDFKNKVRFSALVLKPRYLSRPFVFFHTNIIDYVIDLINYIFTKRTEPSSKLARRDVAPNSLGLFCPSRKGCRGRAGPQLWQSGPQGRSSNSSVIL
jgi:hypothetical protein